MKHYSISILFLFVFTLGFSQNISSIDFVIKNLGINVDGHFNTFTISSEFDSNGELTGVSGKVTVSSIETGIDSRDEHLLEDDYFDTKNYEYITINSTSISKKANNLYSAKIDLEIKGKTKQITIPLKVEKLVDSYKITSNFEINRKDFDVGGSSFVMSKTVKVIVVYYKKL